MKIVASACVFGLLLCLGVAWWARTSGPKAAAARSDESAASVSFNAKRESGGDNRIVSDTHRRRERTWIPTDAERADDDGAYLTWTPTDAERPSDNGASLTWVPSDAERENDDGATLTWVATDAERSDDVGVLIRAWGSRM